MNAEFGLRGQTVKFKWVGSKSMLHSCAREQAGLTPDLGGLTR